MTGLPHPPTYPSIIMSTIQQPTNSLNPASVQELDAELHTAIEQERQRQGNHLELIASENFTLPAVMELTGSVLTNKYAEGYPGKRYYGGCEYVDVAEQLVKLITAQRNFQANAQVITTADSVTQTIINIR